MEGAAIRLEYELIVDGETVAPRSVRIEPMGAGSYRVTAELVSDAFSATITDRLIYEPLADTTNERTEAALQCERWRIDRTWSIITERRRRCIFAFALSAPVAPQYWLVPAVMYDENRYGEGRFPRGGVDIGWSFCEDRCALPSSAMVCDAHRFVAVATKPAETERDLSSVKTSRATGGVTGGVRFELRTPYTESPRRYIRKRGRGALAAPRERTHQCQGSTRYSRRFFVQRGVVLCDTTMNPSDAFGAFYGWMWSELSNDAAVAQTVANYDWSHFIRLKAEFLMNVHYVRTGWCAGFLMLPARSLFPLSNTLSGAFLGRNTEIALALYRVYAATGQERLREAALATLDFFTEGALENGLHYNSYQIARRRWTGYFETGTKNASCRTMGFMAYNFIRAYRRVRAHEGEDAARRCERWMRCARDICDFFVSHQLENGNLGKWWSPSGEPVDTSGVTGAYIIWALVLLSRENDAQHYLRCARRAADYYIDAFVAPAIYWGDALDSNCIDKEGGHSLLRALLMLFDATGQRRYLDAARQTGAYILSWMFAYDVPLPEGTALAERGFATTGGTSVSVAHHHLDMYGAAIAVDLLRLGVATGEERWRRYATAALAFVTQMLADEEDHLGYPPYFRGFQPEQYNHTEWDYVWTGFKAKGDFRNQVCWVPALTLGALLDCREEFPGLLDAAGDRCELDSVRFAHGMRYRLASALRALGCRLNWFI